MTRQRKASTERYGNGNCSQQRIINPPTLIPKLMADNTLPTMAPTDTTQDATPAEHPAPAPTAARGGAPPANTNAIRHGLTCGSDPSPYVTRLTTQFRQQVEQAVLAAVGSIGVAAASEIQAAAEWENHRIKCKRWLKKAGDSLTTEQRLALSREAAKAASERTRHLKALCIGSPAKRSLWATLDATAREADTNTTQEAA
jgi:hypothetical protein